MELLKSKADAASIRCTKAMTVRVLKSQIAIPFFIKIALLFCNVISLNIASYYIIRYSC